MKYEIISTGSNGNAVTINDIVLIDVGVPFKQLQSIYKKLKLVLLTHIHSDHFNKRAIKKLAKERPNLRWGCCSWLVQPLIEAGVEKSKIDVLEFNHMYGYGICNIIPVKLYHNVPNCGYKLHFKDGKAIYATDTNSLLGIQAKEYELYLIEANHEEAEILERIKDKQERGEYAYEMQAMQNHLSLAKANEFIYANAGTNSKYVYLHCHKDKKEGDENNNYSTNT